MDQSINDKGFCKTAPATPGLLIIGIMCRKKLALEKSNVFFEEEKY